MSDDEFLLRAVMPKEQVDAMVAAGPATRTYNPDTRPLIELLRELTRHPRTAEIGVAKGNFRLRLRATPSS